MSVLDPRLSRRSFTKSAAAVSAGLALGVPASAAVLAQDATPVVETAPGLPPLPEGATVYAEGLWNPRFLVFGEDGTLYISEAGIGGDEVIGQPEVGTSELEGGATPVAEPIATPEEPAAPLSTRGYTGQISAVAPDGTQSVLASGLASYSDGVGPVGIALGVGEVYFAIGGMGVGMGIDPLPEENTVNRLVLETGAVDVIAFPGGYEVDNNPDGTDVNPNLYEMATLGDGRLLVADAGGNTLYTIDPASGAFELAAVIPELGSLPGGEGAPSEMAARQSVPTGVATAPGGVTFVGLLSEFWPEGAPSVLTLGADGTLTPVAGPLSFVVGLAVGPDDHLYASQLFTPPAEGSQEPGIGSVVRVYGDGTIEPVVEGVMMPQGIAFDAAGNMYIATNSLISAPDAPAGQVIRIDGIAAV